MPAPDGKWIELAGSFPPELVTNAAPDTLEANQTPDATGISATDEGYIVRDVDIPTADTRIVKTYTAVNTPDGLVTPAFKADYEWRYNRLWRLSTVALDGAGCANRLVYGAPGYTNAYYRQGEGEIDFNEDTSPLLAKMPIGGAGWALFKATGGYIVPNATSTRGGFAYNDFNQEMYISTATHVTEYNGVVYFCNADGVFSVNAQGEVTELSVPLRGDLPTAAAMKTDYQRGFITIGSTHLYDIARKRWFEYDGSTFLFTTRTLRAELQPMTVDRVAFEFERTGTANTELAFNFQYNDRGYEPDNITLPMPYLRGEEARVHAAIRRDTGHAFCLKVTSLPATVKLKRIWASVNVKTVESRDS